MSNKKAQVGETMTWIVATVIIIVILILTLYTASVLGKMKVAKYDPFETKIDRIEQKITFAYNVDSSNANFIENWIKEVEDG